MSNIDLNKYKDFVEAVTSKASNDLTTFINRCDELDANYIGDGVISTSHCYLLLVLV